jgi:seryl-tRNA synthetase
MLKHFLSQAKLFNKKYKIFMCYKKKAGLERDTRTTRRTIDFNLIEMHLINEPSQSARPLRLNPRYIL